MRLSTRTTPARRASGCAAAVLAMLFSCGIGVINVPSKAEQKNGTGKHSGKAADRIRRIEQGFAPISLVANESPVKLNLQRLMEISNVRELSVAVIEGYRIDWAKGYGLRESGAPVTPHTLFQAASISKPISTLAALRLVDEGKLSLDEDVNLKLTSWKVPENEYTKDQKVTLRRILTHTAGATVHGFLGYERGQPIPTLREILEGEKPANNPPIRVDFVPGAKQRYSGGGFTILQKLMIDVTGKPYPQIMQELVLNKLGLKDSTYEQPLPPSRSGVTATGRNPNGEPLPGKWNVAPEMACCGLTTTPSDLARIAIEVALSKEGKSNRIVSAGMAREMLRPQTDPKLESAEMGSQGRFGLGWYLGDESDPRRFGHTGVNPGFSAEIIMWESGRGVVVMVDNWSFESRCVMRYLINNIAKEYGWSYRYSPYTPWPYADTVLLATAKLRGAQAAIAKYYELKKLAAERKGNGAPTVVFASDSPDYLPNEWDLLSVANAIADAPHLSDAIEILKVEIQEYPKWAPAYRRLGELYVRAGRKELAIQTYRAFLKIEPDNKMMNQTLQELKEGKAANQ